MKVTAPVKGWTGKVGDGITFADGVAFLPADSPALHHFRQAGYTVEEVDAGPAADVDRTAHIERLRAELAELEAAQAAAEPAAEPVKMPARSASKAEWKAYAVSRGMPEDEAERTSRDALAERYTSEEAGK